MASRTGSTLFQHIEELQGDRPWGSFLDAGTGTHSARWMMSLATERWTAVTGAEGHAVEVRDAVARMRRAGDRLILGNWADPDLLKGEIYDTVLADYLLGAIEGFAPYFQESLFSRLRLLTGRRLYVVGLEPYVSVRPENEGERLIFEIGRHRDACLMLAGERPYREYPLVWVVQNLRRSGYRVVASRHFGIRYTDRFVNSQIDMTVMRLRKLEDRKLAEALARRGEGLRKAALDMIARQGDIRCGHDYVIAAEPIG